MTKSRESWKPDIAARPDDAHADFRSCFTQQQCATFLWCSGPEGGPENHQTIEIDTEPAWHSSELADIVAEY